MSLVSKSFRTAVLRVKESAPTRDLPHWDAFLHAFRTGSLASIKVLMQRSDGCQHLFESFTYLILMYQSSAIRNVYSSTQLEIADLIISAFRASSEYNSNMRKWKHIIRDWFEDEATSYSVDYFQIDPIYSSVIKAFLTPRDFREICGIMKRRARDIADDGPDRPNYHGHIDY